MITVASKLQYDQARKDINVLSLEQTINTRMLNRITEKLSALEETYSDNKDLLEENDDYQYLVAQQTAYDTRNDSIDTELKLLNQDMDTFQSLQQSGIKSSTSFWCFGG